MSASKIIKFINNPLLIFNHLGMEGVLNWIPDKKYLKIAYWCKMHKILNIDDPQTFNEKIQWLKLYDRKPIYTSMVDKYEAKKYVASIIGEKYIVPTYGVYENFDDIDFDKLPDQFVLKCTHDSGGLSIVKDKSKIDKQKTRSKFEKCLKRNFYWGGREWPYKDVKQRIIAEKYLEDTTTHELRDYKFFSFDGETKVMFVATGRQKENEDVKFDFFDMEFNHLPIKHGHENSMEKIEKPVNFELMSRLSERISQGVPELRVDFYEVNGSVYFGEMTFYHHTGMVEFEPEEWDYIFGSWIKLPVLKQ